MRLWMQAMAALALAGCAAGSAERAPDPAPGGGWRSEAAPQQAAAAAGTAELERRLRERLAAAPGEVAVALVDLETGTRLGVSEDVSMHAASTMKVPVLLELYRQAAAGRFDLEGDMVVRTEFRSIADSSTYALSPEDDSEQALYRLAGRPVAVRELARRMIVESSNLATNLLIEEVGAAEVRALMAALGAEDMVVLRGVEDIPAYRRGLNNTATARAFAAVLEAIARCERGDVAPALEPLEPRHCREITEILAEQRFDEKIPAGVPAGVRVANKTGWITEIDHDGAIVYPPGRAPYVLVVLTRGIADTLQSTAVARDVSAIVWEELAGGAVAGLRGLWDHLAALHARHRVPGLEEREFTHAEYWSAVAPILAGTDRLTRERIGMSVEGRPIYAVRYGTGPTTVLLWSQMHGDEATATMALADLFHFLATPQMEPPGPHPVARMIAERLTLVFVPMLNPDGAEDFRRRNALGIDINRDARALVTPEGRALKALRDRLEPAFGFNLHDQNVRTRVGDEERTAAIALLAPAWGESRDVDALRERAIRVAGLIRLALEPLVGGHIAKYDDTFNPRAFGDLMAQWGTSTILIESGGWRDDPEKQYLRKANFVAILAALEAIATERWQQISPDWYHTLPYNGPSVSDFLLTGGTVVLPGVEPYRADLALQFSEPLEWREARVSDVGDLEGYTARDTLAVDGLYVHFRTREAGLAALERGVIGAPADLVVRRTAEPGSEAVWVIPCARPERAGGAAAAPSPACEGAVRD